MLCVTGLLRVHMPESGPSENPVEAQPVKKRQHVVKKLVIISWKLSTVIPCDGVNYMNQISNLLKSALWVIIPWK